MSQVNGMGERFVFIPMTALPRAMSRTVQKLVWLRQQCQDLRLGGGEESAERAMLLEVGVDGEESVYSIDCMSVLSATSCLAQSVILQPQSAKMVLKS